MKLSSLLLAAALSAGVGLLAPAAEKSAPPASDASPAMPLSGQYSGTWAASDGTRGDLRIKFERRSGENPWHAEASFTFQDAEIPTRLKSIQVDGQKIQLTFDWRIQDTSGQSKLNGELSGNELKGTYESTTADGTTRGVWTVKRS